MYIFLQNSALYKLRHDDFAIHGHEVWLRRSSYTNSYELLSRMKRSEEDPGLLPKRVQLHFTQFFIPKQGKPGH